MSFRLTLKDQALLYFFILPVFSAVPLLAHVIDNDNNESLHRIKTSTIIKLMFGPVKKKVLKNKFTICKS